MNARRLMRKTLERVKPYVPGKPIEEAQRELGISDIVKLASNENLIGPAPELFDALKEAFSKVNYYPDAGQYSLRLAIAQHWGVEFSRVFVGNGSGEIIKMVGETFLNPGDEVIYPDPSFPHYEFACVLMDGTPVPVPLKDFQLDLDAMAERVTSRTKLIFICNPNNPTGTIVRKQELEKFIKNIPPSIIVVIDEAYAEYVNDPDFPRGVDYVKQDCNLIVLRTFSKIYGLAGLRVGYALTKPDIVDCLERVREPFNCNAVAQLMAYYALQHPEHVEHCRKQINEGKRLLYKGLEELKLKYIPTQSNFILIDPGVDAETLYQQLLSKGVIVRPAKSFGFPGWIRVTVGTPSQNERFLAALREALQGAG